MAPDESIRAIQEPDLAQFPVLQGSPLGEIIAQSAQVLDVKVAFPDEDPRCVMSHWTTPGGLQCAIWVFGDPTRRPNESTTVPGGDHSRIRPRSSLGHRRSQRGSDDGLPP